MITLIVGTNRPGSNTRKVAAEIEAIYAELQVPLHVLDLASLPPEIFSTNILANTTWQAPCVQIEDWPRFQWRGYKIGRAHV